MKNRYVLLATLPLIAIAAFGAVAARLDWQFSQRGPAFVVNVLAALIIHLIELAGRTEQDVPIFSPPPASVREAKGRCSIEMILAKPFRAWPRLHAC